MGDLAHNPRAVVTDDFKGCQLPAAGYSLPAVWLPHHRESLRLEILQRLFERCLPQLSTGALSWNL